MTLTLTLTLYDFNISNIYYLNQERGLNRILEYSSVFTIKNLNVTI